MNNLLGNTETITLTAGSALTSGAPVIGEVAGTFMVPLHDAASGDKAAFQTCGVMRLDKVSAAISSTLHNAAETISALDPIYWDSVNEKATTKAIGIRIGYARDDAASSATTVNVVVEDPRWASAIDVVAVLDASLNSTIATHNLPGAKIPAGFVVKSFTYEVLTTFTSATDAATIALGVQTQDDDCLKTATAISTGTTWDAISPATPVQGNAAAVIRTTSERSITAKIAVEALTAGRLVVIAHCVRHGVSA